MLNRFPEFGIFRPIDKIIWIIGESFGWLIGESFNLASGPKRITAGAVWGLLFGASLWFIIWFMRQPRPKGRWWFAALPLWTFFGVVGSSVLMGTSFALSMTISNAVSKVANLYLGWVIAGAIMGIVIGSVTGLAYIRMLQLNKSEKANMRDPFRRLIK